MCFDTDSRPPIEPIAGGALDSRELILEGEDAAEFRAFEAKAAQPTGAAILILPDVRGLHPFFEELALRYAENGITALAIDYFGRTHGTEPHPDDFDHTPHVAAMKWAHLAGDIRTGVRHLRVSEPAPRSLFVTGFCIGGRLTSLAATLRLGLAGVITYYGWPVGAGRGGTPAPADLANEIECAVLALYGGADEAITEDMRNTYDKALEAAHVEHRTVVYDGAPHSFFDKKADEFKDASDAAWNETLTFIRRHTAGQPIAAKA
jgi:carboxymethylenebutenolidase